MNQKNIYFFILSMSIPLGIVNNVQAASEPSICSPIGAKKLPRAYSSQEPTNSGLKTGLRIATGLGISYLGALGHELGHRTAYNIVFPGLVTKMKVGLLDSYVKLNSNMTEELYALAKKNFKTRAKLAVGIAAGPFAGIATDYAMLKIINITDEYYQGKSLLEAVSAGLEKSALANPDAPVLLTPHLVAYLGILNNIYNGIAANPSCDGSKLYHAIFHGRHLPKAYSNINNYLTRMSESEMLELYKTMNVSPSKTRFAVSPFNQLAIKGALMPHRAPEELHKKSIRFLKSAIFRNIGGYASAVLLFGAGIFYKIKTSEDAI